MEALWGDTVVTTAMEVTTMATITTHGRAITSPGLTMEVTTEGGPGVRFRPLSLVSTTGAGEGAVTTLAQGSDTHTR